MKFQIIFFLMWSIHVVGQVEEDAVSCGPAIKKETQQGDVYQIVDEVAEYPGGSIALKKFFIENLIYSKEVIEGGYAGKFYFKFIVDKDGTCRDFRITKSTIECTECEKEVLRVLRLMPKWKPGSVDGKAISSWYRLPVTFEPK